MRYLLNSPVLGTYGTYRLTRATSGLMAVWATQGFISAVGHEGAAQLLTEMLGVPVPVCRRAVTLEVGDDALVLRLVHRLPEGRVLSIDELRRWPHELAWLKRLY